MVPLARLDPDASVDDPHGDAIGIAAHELEPIALEPQAEAVLLRVAAQHPWALAAPRPLAIADPELEGALLVDKIAAAKEWEPQHCALLAGGSGSLRLAGTRAVGERHKGPEVDAPALPDVGHRHVGRVFEAALERDLGVGGRGMGLQVALPGRGKQVAAAIAERKVPGACKAGQRGHPLEAPSFLDVLGVTGLFGHGGQVGGHEHAHRAVGARLGVARAVGDQPVGGGVGLEQCAVAPPQVAHLGVARPEAVGADERVGGAEHRRLEPLVGARCGGLVHGQRFEHQALCEAPVAVEPVAGAPLCLEEPLHVGLQRGLVGRCVLRRGHGRHVGGEAQVHHRQRRRQGRARGVVGVAGREGRILERRVEQRAVAGQQEHRPRASVPTGVEAQARRVVRPVAQARVVAGPGPGRVAARDVVERADVGQVERHRACGPQHEGVAVAQVLPRQRVGRIEAMAEELAVGGVEARARALLRHGHQALDERQLSLPGIDSGHHERVGAPHGPRLARHHPQRQPLDILDAHERRRLHFALAGTLDDERHDAARARAVGAVVPHAIGPRRLAHLQELAAFAGEQRVEDTRAERVQANGPRRGVPDAAVARRAGRSGRGGARKGGQWAVERTRQVEHGRRRLAVERQQDVVRLRAPGQELLARAGLGGEDAHLHRAVAGHPQRLGVVRPHVAHACHHPLHGVAQAQGARRRRTRGDIVVPLGHLVAGQGPAPGRILHQLRLVALRPELAAVRGVETACPREHEPLEPAQPKRHPQAQIAHQKRIRLQALRQRQLLVVDHGELEPHPRLPRVEMQPSHVVAQGRPVLRLEASLRAQHRPHRPPRLHRHLRRPQARVEHPRPGRRPRVAHLDVAARHAAEVQQHPFAPSVPHHVLLPFGVERGAHHLHPAERLARRAVEHGEATLAEPLRPHPVAAQEHAVGRAELHERGVPRALGARHLLCRHQPQAIACRAPTHQRQALPAHAHHVEHVEARLAHLEERGARAHDDVGLVLLHQQGFGQVLLAARAGAVGQPVGRVALPSLRGRLEVQQRPLQRRVGPPAQHGDLERHLRSLRVGQPQLMRRGERPARPRHPAGDRRVGLVHARAVAHHQPQPLPGPRGRGAHGQQCCHDAQRREPVEPRQGERPHGCPLVVECGWVGE